MDLGSSSGIFNYKMRELATRRLCCVLVLLFALLATACQAEPTIRSDVTLVVTSVTSTLEMQPTHPPTPTRTPNPHQPETTPTSAPSPTVTTTQSPTPTQPPVTTLLFTGVIVPARCVQASIDERGDPHYVYDEVREIITQADIAIGTFNATMSDYPPHTGCVSTYVLVGGPDNADALARAGFDVMSVATNHIKNCGLTNCGNRAFFDTLENLRRVGIQPVGAGVNHDEAMQPVVMTVNGIRFGIVSLGHIESMAFAGEDKPGIAVLNEDNLKTAIDATRQVADVVIVMPHWGPEDVSWPSYVQRNLAHSLVEAGADLVMGNHTHVVQAVQEIDGVPVFYGLGNFVFDQWPRDHQQGVILLVRFEGDRYSGYEFIPTHVDRDGTVHIADGEEAVEILERIRQASQGLK